MASDWPSSGPVVSLKPFLGNVVFWMICSGCTQKCKGEDRSLGTVSTSASRNEFPVGKQAYCWRKLKIDCQAITV